MDWNLEPIFGSYWIPGALAFVMLAGWWGIREDRQTGLYRRVILASLRLILILAILLGLFRPGLTWTEQTAPRGAVAVMLDTSQSMELTSGSSGKSRWQVEWETWSRLQKWQSELGPDSPLVLYGYDEQLRTTEEMSRWSVSTSPNGAATDVGKSLSMLMASQIDPPLSAVVWMGDGTQTMIPATIDPQQMARQLAQLDVPLLLIGIGPRGESDRIKDLALESVPEQIQVFSSNQTQVLGLLHARGAMNQEIPIQLWVKGIDPSPKLIAQQVVRADSLDQTIPFRLPLTAPEVGSYELEVRVPESNGEVSVENNSYLCFLNVRKGGSRVLYMEGEPRWEQKFLMESLDANPEFQVDVVNVRRRDWPKDFTPQFKSKEYDAYILGDVDAAAMTPSSLQMLSDRIREGAGCLTLGGYSSYGPGGYAKTQLANILPIEMDDRWRHRPGTPFRPEAHYPSEPPIPLRPRSTASQVYHPLATLGSANENLKLWLGLEPMRGACRIQPKVAPGVQVILEGTKGEPMSVTGTAERGRVVSMAMDTTYQWRLQGKGELHRTFWRQVILWMMRRENPEEGIEVEMNQRRLTKQQSTEVTIHWNPGTQANPIPAETRSALYQGDRQIGTITLTKEDDQTMKGKFLAPSESGRYELRTTSLDSQGKKLESKLPFAVLDQSNERMQPIPDWSLLSQMAKLNEPARGGLFAPEEIDRVAEQLLERQKKSTMNVIQTFRLGEGTWDSWGLLAFIVGTLTLQWILRKRWNLA